MNTRRFAIVVLLTGILGGLFFFPFPLSENYTCIYHRVFNADEPVLEDESASHSHLPGTSAHHLLDSYIRGYAFLWWASLLMVVGALFYVRRNVKVNSKNRVKTL
ncbi:MAG TPA: hypothetical protein ENJ10_14615 [Caldithrix abyssi]|uniref:Uncharacterized protein n=1 Tax=Caldithrix abyssi TaxID=187145 RepID=A0A7V1LPY8_CALAY|nr:hypothetical protein [Caldithrix abyssi]